MANWEDDWETLRPAPKGGRGRALYLVGRHFGRLKVIERAGSDKNGASLWRCLCTCGNEKVVKRGHLKSGKVKSCGCLLVEYKQQAFKKGLNRGAEPIEWVTIHALHTVGIRHINGEDEVLRASHVRRVMYTDDIRALVRNGQVQIVAEDTAEGEAMYPREDMYDDEPQGG